MCQCGLVIDERSPMIVGPEEKPSQHIYHLYPHHHHHHLHQQPQQQYNLFAVFLNVSQKQTTFSYLNSLVKKNS